MVSLDGMDLEDRVREISSRVSRRAGSVATEEATKTALVMPFIREVLGYNVFEPEEVIPEFTADVGGKKGEKVDYAIMNDGKPSILIECKAYGVDLEKDPPAQLARYFHTTEARVGIVTDGVRYRFFSDVEKSNVMDDRPFFEIDMLEPDSIDMPELRKFAKATFDLGQVLDTAKDLKYLTEIKKMLNSEWTDPSEQFVRYFMSQVYEGVKTKQRVDQFQQLLKRACHEFLTDRIQDRLKTALQDGSNPIEVPPELSEEPDESSQDGVVTLEDEWQGFYVVKAILRDHVDAHRITMRDRKSYCAILLDNRTTRTICRLHFHRSQKYVSFFDNDRDERIPIGDVDDLFEHAQRLKDTVSKYEDAQTG